MSNTETHKQVALFGGTFDPPTLAHEDIIRNCLDRDDMDEVWVMPSGHRIDKPGMLHDHTRLAMLNLILHETFQDDPRLKVSEFEMDLPQPTHTYDTVQALGRTYPDTDFWYVYGADSYQTMHTWQHGEELRRTMGMLLVHRAGWELPEETERLRRLDVGLIADRGISSTVVRAAMREGVDVSEYISPTVENFLRREACYTAGV
jgi:nicotinate-nucleotide adenylyltransferase